MTKFISNRVKKTPSALVPNDRYQFIKLEDVEPDLGIPHSDSSVFSSTVTGDRVWLSWNSGFSIDTELNQINLDNTVVRTFGDFVLSGNLTVPALTVTETGTFGVITAGSWQATVIASEYGGTGVDNGSNTISVSGNFSTTGNYPVELSTTAPTTLVLPASGTVATLTGTEEFTNKTISADTNTIENLKDVNLSTSANIANNKLANSSVTIGTTAVSLGETATSLTGIDGITANTVLVGGIELADNSIVSTASTSDLIIKSHPDRSINVQGSRIINVPEPVFPLEAANKAYVDAVAAGIRVRPDAKAATAQDLGATFDSVQGRLSIAANGNGTLTVDGVILVLDDTVLVKDQTNLAENGIYVVIQESDGSTDWILERCEFCNQAQDLAGSFFFIRSGIANAATGWILVIDDPDTFVINQDPINVIQFSDATEYQAGVGLSLTGNVFNVSTDLSHVTQLGTVTQGTWQADTVQAAYGGTGFDSYTSGQILVGNSSGTLSRSTLAAGSGIDVINASGSITVANADPGSDQTIFKNIADQSGTVQFSAANNNDSLRFAAGEGSTVSFNSTTRAITVAHASTTPADNLVTTNTTNSVLQNISLEFDSFGHVIGATASSVDLGSFASTSQVAVVDNDQGFTWQSTGSGAFSEIKFVSGVGNDIDIDLASQAIRVTNTDPGSDQTIFKTISVVRTDNTTRGSVVAQSNTSTLTLKESAGIVTTVDAANSTVTLMHGNTSSQSTVTNSAGTVIQSVAIDSFGHVTGLTSSNLDLRYVDLTSTQTVTGSKTFSNAVILSTQASAVQHAVRADRAVLSGVGLTGGGNLTENRTLSLENIAAGSALQGTVFYNGTVQSAGRFDGGTAVPSSTTRLNYNGHLYATKFVGDGSSLTNLPGSDLSYISSASNGTIQPDSGTAAVIPAADQFIAGLITTGNQTFAGTKTFNNTITGSISGNAGTATSLQTARSINGTSFNGTANITVPTNVTGRSVNESGHILFIGTTATGNQQAYTNSAFRVNSSTGELSATDFNSSSDQTLKENVRTIESALSVVKQLRGVRYNWKNSGQSSIGVIAQEIQQVLPEVVGSNGDHLTVAYGNIVAVLIEAVKEQQNTIDQLLETVDRLTK